MTTTIFNTPILTNLLQHSARAAIKLVGWRIEGGLPDLPKFIVIAAPHTTNWDFVMFLGMVLQLKADVRYIGKAELFRGPLGFFFYYCGGIPVDRTKSNGLVDSMIKAFNDAERLILVIAPEGTRSKVTEWKRGFYHIAQGAGVPIVMAVVDGVKKVITVGQIFHTTGDMESDVKSVQSFFAGMKGIKLLQTSEI